MHVGKTPGLYTSLLHDETDKTASKSSLRWDSKRFLGKGLRLLA